MVWKNKDSEERGVREGLEAAAKPQPRREGRGPKLAPIAAKKERNQRSPALAAAFRPGQALRPEGFLFYFFFRRGFCARMAQTVPDGAQGLPKSGAGSSRGDIPGTSAAPPGSAEPRFLRYFPQDLGVMRG